MKVPEPEFVELLKRTALYSWGFEKDSWEHFAMSLMLARGWVSVRTIRPNVGLWQVTPIGRLVLLIADALKGTS